MSVVGCWRLNGTLNDDSGNAYNGTGTNITYAQSNGRINQGALFDGTISKIVSPTIAFSGKITVNAWVKIPSSYGGSNNTNPAIFSIRTDADTYRFDGLAWHYALSYKVQFQHYNGSAWTQLQSLAALSVGWRMITYIYDPGVTNGMKIYVDGVLNNQGTPAATLVVTAPISFGAVRLAGSPNAGSFFNSAIDEVSLDNTIWSSSRIKNEYARVKGFF